MFVYPELLQNKIIVKKGEIITSQILGTNDLGYKNINSKIKNLLRKQETKSSQEDLLLTKLQQERTLLKKLEIS